MKPLRGAGRALPFRRAGTVLAAAGTACCAALFTAAPARAVPVSRQVTAVRPARTAVPCPTTMGRIACVDLTHQRMWVQVGRKVVLGPVPVRTGRRGYATRTGLWHVYWRHLHHYSTLYRVAMPYSQFFSGGEAFHALLGEPLATPPGSHGCVNMTNADARALWRVLKLHDPVKVFGRKPGT